MICQKDYLVMTLVKLLIYEDEIRVEKQDFVKYHLRDALRGAAAEVNGDEELSRRLRAETRLRLIGMSDEQLRELAKQTSCPPEMPVELAYKRHKQAVEELKATASEWMNDLKIPIPDREGRNGR